MVPIEFGSITSADRHTASIELDNEELLQLEAAQLQQLGQPDLRVGDRVRLQMESGQVVSLVVIAHAAAVSDRTDERVAARITAVDRAAGVLHLQLGSETAQFRPGSLSDSQWRQLAPGVEITLRKTADGKARLMLPATSRDDSRARPPSTAPVVTTTGRGRVLQVGPYHVVVSTAQNRQYGFMLAQFPGQTFREGDEVIFRAVDASGEIVEIGVLERKAPGVGGSDPCGRQWQDLEAYTDRPAMTQLAQRFCGDRRLVWHWITPAQEATPASLKRALDPVLVQAIRQAEPAFQQFFRHQARAIDALDSHRHVLVLTPTASGKTFCYNPAVFQMLLNDPSARALYVFPLNALLQDQVSKLHAMAHALRAAGADIGIDLLIGGLSADKRQELQAHPPQILAVNPEMLSYVLERNSRGGWPDFFQRLRFVVLDEVHTYRSLIGLQMAGLVRRMMIVCRRAGNERVRFVLSSATVGAPQELATRLTSLPIEDFTIIDDQEDGSEQQKRHWMVLAPTAESGKNLHQAHLNQAAQALVDVLTVPDEELNVILFAKSMRDVRYVHAATVRLLEGKQRKDLAPKVRQYVGALMESEEKRRVYEGLRDGSLRAVVSTNALEAGIDIGKLDVGIIAGFPFHVMRLRQMAGRAGRRKEGAVIYIPHPTHSVDQFYADHPERLLTQPPETFVIDHENPYIARKHVVACAATMAGGVAYHELAAFGRQLDKMLQEAIDAGVIQQASPTTYTAPPHRRQAPWDIGNLRSSEQIPYMICQADEERWRTCASRGCYELGREKDKGKCPYRVQAIDRQYVYREAHPGAVFEDQDGKLHRIVDLDDKQRLLRAQPLPDDCLTRTFADENVSVEIIEQQQQRHQLRGAQLGWGDVRVTREYYGFYTYALIERRRCTSCRTTYSPEVETCPHCARETRPYFDTTKPEYTDYPGVYKDRVFEIELKTKATWLALPASLDTQLEPISRCRIPGQHNRVSHFLQTSPAFRDAGDLARVVGLAEDAARAAFEYFAWGNDILARHRAPKKRVTAFPFFYGQCLRYALRQQLPEDQALQAFAACTGYPVLTEDAHVCRNCVGSSLLTAAHTVEHLVALQYPIVALGDSQDLGFTSYVLHPQTQQTTIFWYDNYDGGLGAAEKIFDQFDVLLQRSLEGLDCRCHSDRGCPLCIQTLQCDRRNETLSKVAARALLHHLLGMPRYIPDEPVFWAEEEARTQEDRSGRQEKTRKPARPPSGPVTAGLDPCLILRVQPYVHDRVLRKVIEVRGEEIADEVPAINVATLQAAYQQMLASPRATEWQFPPEWDCYQILHVQPEASKRLSHSAYKVIVRHVHPDVNSESWATEVTKRVNDAWDKVRDQRTVPD